MKKTLACIIAVIGVLLAYEAGHHRSTAVDPYTDTIRITVVDTVKVRVPVPVDSVVVRHITKAIHVRDTLYDVRVKDSMVYVTLPIEQKHYSGEDYDAWVSGYEPRLDSINVYRRRETVFVQKRSRRWNVGPSVGVGLTTEGIRPYIGVGITYTLF